MNLTMLKKFRKPLLGVAAVVLVLLSLLSVPTVRYALQDMTFSWTERTETERKVKAYAESQGVYFAQYPKSLIELLERNPETEAFVLRYPFREEREPDLSGYDRREGVPLFLQWDPMWGYERYGSDFLAVTGCGPTCLAMAGYYLTGSEAMNPAEIARFAEDSGYYAKGYGSSWTLISEGSAKLGLAAEELPLVKGKMVKVLEEGRSVILAMGAGDFTSGGHYILLTGVEKEAFRVNDPNSIQNSQKLWTYEQLEGQIRNIWAISLQK